MSVIVKWVFVNFFLLAGFWVLFGEVCILYVIIRFKFKDFIFSVYEVVGFCFWGYCNG